MVRTRTLAIPLVLSCLLWSVLSGCGGDDGGSGSSGSSSGATSGSGSGSGSKDGSGSSSTGSGVDSSPNPEVDDKGAPGKPDSQGRQGVVFKRIPGNSSGACATVGSRRDVRSGGFVAGPFDDASKSWGTKRAGFKRHEVQLYFVPLHAKSMPGLKVSATSGGRRVTFSQKVVSDAEQWKFYDARIVVPEGGTWTFRATSGPDRGCFTARF